MLTMTETCPNCGDELSLDNVAGGLCGRCLLERGIEFASTACFADGSTPGALPFTAPDPVEVEADLLNFDVLDLVGQGGMGAVYKARQRNLDRTVAIKILPRQAAGGQEFADRFQREARALARLRHDHIVMAYDFGLTDRYLYSVMEYVGGPNLREYLRSQEPSPSGRGQGEGACCRLSPRHALEIARDICTALQYAHENGVVHRDIKPENVLLDEVGHVKIADFGLAKLLQPDPRELALTQTRHFMGTLHYMAPEQCERPQATDHRADIYSVGVLLYEMLTGELPIGRFDLPSSNASIDPRLDDLILRALHKDPARRYESAAEFGTAIDAALADPVVPAVNNNPRSVNSKRRRIPRAAAVAAGFAAFFALAYLGWQIFLKYERDKDGKSSFTMQASGGDDQATKLASHGGRLAERGVDELLEAASKRQSSEVRRLLNAGMDINGKNAEGETALMKAAANGRLAAVDTLIQLGANSKEQDIYGRTALMHAAEAGHTSVITALFKANPPTSPRSGTFNAQDDEGQTALIKAAAKGHFECLQTLLNIENIDLWAKDRQGRTALMHLIANKRLDLLRQLAANPNKEVETDVGSYRYNRLLGPGVIAAYPREKNAIQAAEEMGHSEIAKFLRTEMQRAVDHFSRAIEKGGPAQGKAHVWRSYAYRALGETEKADEDATAANLRATTDTQERSVAEAGIEERNVPPDKRNPPATVTKIFSLSETTAQNTLMVIERLFRGSGANLVADERSNSIIAKGDAQTLAEIEAIIMKLDEAPRRNADGKKPDIPSDKRNAPAKEMKVYRLKYTQAPEALNLLQTLFRDTEARLVSDDRTNSILAQGDAETLAKIEAIIQRLDVATDRTAKLDRRIDEKRIVVDRLEQATKQLRSQILEIKKELLALSAKEKANDDDQRKKNLLLNDIRSLQSKLTQLETEEAAANREIEDLKADKVPIDSKGSTSPELAATRLGPGYRLRISVTGTLPGAPIDGIYIVDADGYVNLGAHYGKLKVSGMTADEAQAKLLAQISKYLTSPKATLTIQTFDRRNLNQRAEPPYPSDKIGSERSRPQSDFSPQRRQSIESELKQHRQSLLAIEMQLQNGVPNARQTVESKRLSDEAGRLKEKIKMLEMSLNRLESDAQSAEWPLATILSPGYTVRISAAGTTADAPISGLYVVDRDGYVNLGGLYGKVRVTGMSADEAQDAILKELQKTLREPRVVLTIEAFDRRNPDETRTPRYPSAKERQASPPSERDPNDRRTNPLREGRRRIDPGSNDFRLDDSVLVRPMRQQWNSRSNEPTTSEERTASPVFIDAVKVQSELGGMMLEYMIYNELQDATGRFFLVINGPHIGRKEFPLDSWPHIGEDGKIETRFGGMFMPRKLNISNGEPIEIDVEWEKTPEAKRVRISNVRKVKWTVPGAPTEDIRYPKGLMKPFTAIHWEKDRPQVEIDGRWYELLAINDHKTEAILDLAKKTQPDDYQKKVEDDLESLIGKLSEKWIENLQIKLRRLDNGQVELIDVRRTPDGAKIVQRSTLEDKTQSDKKSEELPKDAAKR